MLGRLAPSPSALLKSHWEGLTKEHQLWEEARPTTTYYQGLLSPALATLIYSYPPWVLANLCSRNEVLVKPLEYIYYFL